MKSILFIEKEPQTIKVLKQTGKVKSMVRDQGRPAKLPGKRISKTGKIYYETRRNRSDSFGKRV